MPCPYPLEGAPVHPLGFPAIAMKYPLFPAKSLPDAFCLALAPLVGALPLAGVSQLIAASAGVDGATLEDRPPELGLVLDRNIPGLQEAMIEHMGRLMAPGR